MNGTLRRRETNSPVRKVRRSGPKLKEWGTLKSRAKRRATKSLENGLKKVALEHQTNPEVVAADIIHRLNHFKYYSISQTLFGDSQSNIWVRLFYSI